MHGRKFSIVQIQTNLRFIEMWNEERNRFRFQSNKMFVKGNKEGECSKREHKKMWPDRMIDIEEMLKENPIESSLSPFHTVSSIENGMIHSTELQSKAEKIKHNKNKRYVQSYDNSDNSNDMKRRWFKREKWKNAHKHCKLRVTSVKYDKKGILRWVTTMEWNERKSHIEKTRLDKPKSLIGSVTQYVVVVVSVDDDISNFSVYWCLIHTKKNKKEWESYYNTTAFSCECTKTKYTRW